MGYTLGERPSLRGRFGSARSGRVGWVGRVGRVVAWKKQGTGGWTQRAAIVDRAAKSQVIATLSSKKVQIVREFFPAPTSSRVRRETVIGIPYGLLNCS